MTKNSVIKFLRHCFVYNETSPYFFIPLSFLYGLIFFYIGCALITKILSPEEMYFFHSPNSFLFFLLFYFASLLGLPFLAIFMYLIFAFVTYIGMAIGSEASLSFIVFKIIELTGDIFLSEIFLLFVLIVVAAFVYIRSKALPLSFISFSLLMFLAYMFNVEVISAIQNLELDIHPS